MARGPQHSPARVNGRGHCHARALPKAQHTACQQKAREQLPFCPPLTFGRQCGRAAEFPAGQGNPVTSGHSGVVHTVLRSLQGGLEASGLLRQETPDLLLWLGLGSEGRVQGSQSAAASAGPANMQMWSHVPRPQSFPMVTAQHTPCPGPCESDPWLHGLHLPSTRPWQALKQPHPSLTHTCTHRNTHAHVHTHAHSHTYIQTPVASWFGPGIRSPTLGALCASSAQPGSVSLREGREGWRKDRQESWVWEGCCSRMERQRHGLQAVSVSSSRFHEAK